MLNVGQSLKYASVYAVFYLIQSPSRCHPRKRFSTGRKIGVRKKFRLFPNDFENVTETFRVIRTLREWVTKVFARDT